MLMEFEPTEETQIIRVEFEALLDKHEKGIKAFTLLSQASS